MNKDKEYVSSCSHLFNLPVFLQILEKKDKIKNVNKYISAKYKKKKKKGTLKIKATVHFKCSTQYL